jgi:peptidoglycan pentaglycine glycine transferase (the first glycine)
MGQDVSCSVSRQGVDSQWDSFLAATPGGDLQQTSQWAIFQAQRGWSPIRLVAKREGVVVGGAQMLVRRFPWTINIARIVHGPILNSYEPKLFELVVRDLMGLVRSEKIQYLAMEPSRSCNLVSELCRWGFRTSHIYPTANASLVLDLSKGPERLLREMRRTTRNNIRIAEDRGITVREGNESDVGVFYKLLEVTSRRRHFHLEPKQYYLDLWRQLKPLQLIQMFVAEHEGEVLSSLLTFPFGDSVSVGKFVWIGSKKWLRPNEMLFWKAIEWSIGNGFRNFDFGGVNLPLAVALSGDSHPPAPVINSNTRFIMGFGGSIVVLPSAYELVPNQLLGWLLRTSSSILDRYSLTKVIRRISD